MSIAGNTMPSFHLAQMCIRDRDITIWQDTVDEVLERGGRAAGVRTELGQTFEAPHVILTTGTFLCGLIHVGLTHFPGGRLGDAAAMKLSDSLRKHGLTLGLSLIHI